MIKEMDTICFAMANVFFVYNFCFATFLNLNLTILFSALKAEEDGRRGVTNSYNGGQYHRSRYGGKAVEAILSHML